MKRTVISAILSVSLLTGCFHHTEPQDIDPTNINQLENLTADNVNVPGASSEAGLLRAKSLQETATSLGAQGGLSWASDQINTWLDRNKKFLETTFNFSGMILTHGVLPPVLQQGDNSLNLADPNTVRIADRTYKILQQARFVTTPPNWREFLWMSFSRPELPNKVFLPRTSEERKVWIKYIQLGWEKGVQQAYGIFQQNLARLKRDYQGMTLYRKLLHERMISPPYVARTELGITGEDGVMRVNDQVLRITALPKLQTNSNSWKAVVVEQNDK